MASRFSEASNHFEQARARLSDTIVGHVLLHDRGRGRHVGGGVVLDEPPALPNPRKKQKTAGATAEPKANLQHATSGEEKERLLAEKKARRREQLRLSQARFRQKKRALKEQEQRQAEEDLQRLQHAIQSLRLRRQSLKLRGKSKPSPWTVVSEVLHLIETSFRSPWCVASTEEMKCHTDIRRSMAFLQTAMVPHVAMGELRGYQELTEQLRKCAQCFGEPQFEATRIEVVAPGVTRASGTLSVTITEATLKSLFPLLASRDDEMGEEDEYAVLRQHLMDQRLHCKSSISFLFDESGSVERVEVAMDLLVALYGVLGDLRAAASVLEGALLSPEGIIGALSGNQTNGDEER